MHFVRSTDGQSLDFNVEQVSEGFKRLRSKNKLGCDGTCPKAFEFLFLSQPELFTSWLSHFVGCTNHMSQLSLQARIFGKEGSLVKMENTRVIMPLPSIFKFN